MTNPYLHPCWSNSLTERTGSRWDIFATTRFSQMLWNWPFLDLHGDKIWGTVICTYHIFASSSCFGRCLGERSLLHCICSVHCSLADATESVYSFSEGYLWWLRICWRGPGLQCYIRSCSLLGIPHPWLQLLHSVVGFLIPLCYKMKMKSNVCEMKMH